MKSEIVAAGVSAIQQAQSEALQAQLESFYDAAVADQPAGPGHEGDMTAEEEQAAIAKASADAHAAAQEQLTALQSQLDAMIAQDQIEDQAVAALKASVEQVQAALDAIKALVSPPAQG